MLRLRSQSPGLAFNDLGIEIASARCYHCGELAGVSARAMTARCEHCGKNLDIPDVRIKGHHWGGVLVTCGRVSIGRRAEVTCTLVIGSLGADVLGRFSGVLVSGGPVTIGPRAQFSGTVWAPSLRIEQGELRAARFGCTDRDLLSALARREGSGPPGAPSRRGAYHSWQGA